MLRVGLVHLWWNRRREGGSFAILASDGPISAHELAELATQGQSQTGSALFLGGRTIGLRKGLEEAAQLFRSHANTTIYDIAGQGLADPASMESALRLAATVAATGIPCWRPAQPSP